MNFKTRIPSMLYGVVLRVRAPAPAPRILGIQSFSVAPQFLIKRPLMLFMCGLVMVALFTMLTLLNSIQIVEDSKESLRKLQSVQRSTTDVPVRSTTDQQIVRLSARNLPTVVCPEIDIPGEENSVSIDVSEISLLDVEEMIFQTSKLKVKKMVKLMADSLVNKLNATSDKCDKQVVEETLTDALLLDKYIYLPGGHWIPAHCLPRWKVAIIIPFRDRDTHLSIFLKHLIPFLQRQYLEFGIYVAEQANTLEFNRAMLMNIGFVEALNFSRWDCFIFHDVDHIPLNYTNYYGCGHMPRHFVTGVDKWDYNLPYDWFFGAATGFTRTQIEKFNGFPNVYWGWGGEDDDIFYRIMKRGFSRTRPWKRTGLYNTIPHNHDSTNENVKRKCLLANFAQRTSSDGLNNLHYSTPNVTVFPLYINISVDIQQLEWNKTWSPCSAGRKKAQKNRKSKG